MSGKTIWLFLTLLFAHTAYSSSERPHSSMITVLLAHHGKAPYLHGAPAHEVSTINEAVLGQLLMIDENLGIKPNLLEQAFFDYNKKAYVLVLREKLKFHNGRYATAKDLEFSLVRGFFSEKRSFYNTYIGNIEGIENAVGKKYASGLIDGVKITGPYHVEVKLKNPNPSFLHSLSNPYFSLVPQEEIDETLLGWKRFPVGVGPYKIKEPGFKDGLLTLERLGNEKEIPHEIKVFTTNLEKKYDLSLLDENHVTSPKAFFPELPGSVTALFFSRLNPLGANIHFRRATSYLIDRESILSKVAGASATDQILPRHFWGRSASLSEKNLEKARHEISLVPKELREKEWTFLVFGGVNASKNSVHISKEIERQLGEIGIRVKAKDSNDKFLTKAQAEDNIFELTGRVTDYIDPLIMFASFRRNGHAPYLSPENDVHFEKLYEKASLEQLREERVETIRSISDYVKDNVICLPLLERRAAIYFNTQKIKSLGQQMHGFSVTLQNIKTHE